jgi:hypothetical protein
MTGTTPNYGWEYVNSGADAVSGPANFAHVPEIDATLSEITGGLVGLRQGLTLMEPNGDGLAETSVSWAALPADAELSVMVTSRTSRPDLVSNETYANLTTTGMDLFAYRSNATTWSVSWIVFAFASTP